ncbi:MAG: chemotaxis protein methyltransferase [Lysobacteraceae bacterium]|nr:MAG: chemotaxis protein methyltransferase [Xanthomonadaceae bacterium]
MAETPQDREFAFSERDFRRVCALIYERAGIALAESKRDMVYSRLARRLRALGMTRFQDYLDHLERADEAEWQAFTNALTTNLTSFFREAHHFEVLQQHLAARKARAPFRIWCAAASTGEEPWSIAMTVCEVFDSLSPPAEILASDIDTQVLEVGKRGVYPLERIKDLAPQRVRRFFQRGTGPNEGLCRIRPPLRGMMRFAQINLLAPDYGLRGPFDAIFCRNVMIYFDKPTQRKVLERMVPLLAPDGLLFAGHSESFLHAADLVRPCGRTVYCRTDAPR